MLIGRGKETEIEDCGMSRVSRYVVLYCRFGSFERGRGCLCDILLMLCEWVATGASSCGLARLDNIRISVALRIWYPNVLFAQ